MKQVLKIVLCVLAVTFSLGANKRYLPPQVESSGLVAHYKLWAGFTSSGSVFDYSLLGGSGTVTNALPAFPGFSFAGADYINIDTALANIQTATGAFTIWFNTTDVTTNQYIICLGDTNANEFMRFYVNNSNLYAQLRIAGTTQWQIDVPGGSLVNDTWFHLAVVQNGTEPIVYVNGVAVTQSFSNSTNKTKWLSHLTGVDNGRIGCGNLDNAGNIGHFSGELDDVMFFDENKTSREIKDIYELTRWRYGV